MNRREKNLFQPDTNSQSLILANWLAVIGDFNSLHNQLSNCLAASVNSPGVAAQGPPWVGHCRTTQIKALLLTMQNELEIMLNDADRFEHLDTQQGYAQLAIHVTHLKQLNEQAQVLLCLASLPTG